MDQIPKLLSACQSLNSSSSAQEDQEQDGGAYKPAPQGYRDPKEYYANANAPPANFGQQAMDAYVVQEQGIGPDADRMHGMVETDDEKKTLGEKINDKFWDIKEK